MKLIGIAIGCLVIFSIVFFVSIKTGITIAGRWFGLAVWTGALLWVIFRQCKKEVRKGRFWIILTGLLAIHFAAFILVLRRYPEWRMAWFPIAYVIEGTFMITVLNTFVRKRRRIKSFHSE